MEFNSFVHISTEKKRIPANTLGYLFSEFFTLNQIWCEIRV